MGKTPPEIQPGTRYTHLVTTGIYIPGRNRKGEKVVIATVECICDCGNRVYKTFSGLETEQTKTCGLKCPLHTNTRNLKHGLCVKIGKEYQVWCHMKYRHKRGQFSVCDAFLNSFQYFSDYIGAAPSPKHRLRRIDKEKGYEEGNIQWSLRYK